LAEPVAAPRGLIAGSDAILRAFREGVKRKGRGIEDHSPGGKATFLVLCR